MFQLVKRVIPPSKVFKGQLPLVRTHISFLKFTERLKKKKHRERERERKDHKFTRTVVSRVINFGIAIQ